MPDRDHWSIDDLREIARGANSPFWKTLKGKLLKLKAEAIEDLVREPPENMAKIAEFQITARLVDLLISHVDTAADELKITEEQAHG